MTLRISQGITDDLVKMIIKRICGHRYYDRYSYLGDQGIKRQLEKFEWVMGIYDDEIADENKCVAGIWGDSTINLITRDGYENKWLNLPVLRKFWKWFFDHYDEAYAVPDNGAVIPFMLRIGFQWDGNRLVCRKSDLRLGA